VLSQQLSRTSSTCYSANHIMHLIIRRWISDLVWQVLHSYKGKLKLIPNSASPSHAHLRAWAYLASRQRKQLPSCFLNNDVCTYSFVARPSLAPCWPHTWFKAMYVVRVGDREREKIFAAQFANGYLHASSIPNLRYTPSVDSEECTHSQNKWRRGCRKQLVKYGLPKLD